jgi:hypothetical protein
VVERQPSKSEAEFKPQCQKKEVLLSIQDSFSVFLGEFCYGKRVHFVCFQIVLSILRVLL